MRNWKPLLILAVAAILVMPGFSKTAKTTEMSMADVGKVVSDAMDTSANACQDFYQYACGGWIENTELPGDQARWVRSFSVIRESNREFVRTVLEDAAMEPGNDPDRQKVGYYYGACMDEETINSRGTKPLEPMFQMVKKVKDASSLLEVSATLQRNNVNVLFGIGIFPDFQNPDLNIAWFFQGGIGMPDRDYYVSDDEKKKGLLADYEKHVARIMGLLGESDEMAAKHAADILAFETELAKSSRPAQEMRDFERLYNKIDMKGFEELTPGLSWKQFAAATGYPDIKDISVATPEFFERLETLAQETPKETLQAYLRWNIANSYANILSSDFVDANFEFYSQKLQGQKENQPRWKRCVASTEGALGEVVGRVYIKERFAGSSKDIATEMIQDIEGAFEEGLPDLEWMDDKTRGRAKEKVSTIQNKIGYPDQWRDYTDLKVKRTDHFANATSSRNFEFDFNAKKIGEKVDRKEWGMTPQMVNAYYNPLWNEIAFPAGILQPPFFNKDHPAAMNYGGIGGVIGHELTHGFDDQGRKFDPQGKMSEWWEPAVSEKFEERAECVNQFYSNYEVAEGANVNGQLTLGENIADIGGVKEAYAAYKNWEKRHDGAKPVVEGLTNDQLFFVSWGQVWCTKATEQYERMQITTDPHSPGRFRVMGPLANNPDFAKAFSCEEGTPMNPKDKCEVW